MIRIIALKEEATVIPAIKIQVQRRDADGKWYEVLTTSRDFHDDAKYHAAWESLGGHRSSEIMEIANRA